MMVNTPTPCFCFHRLTLWPEYGHGLRLGFWSVSFTAGFPFARTKICVLTESARPRSLHLSFRDDTHI